MLTEIRLENFKCFKGPVSIPLKPLSVFIGPNGTGKSTPVQSLLLLKQSVGQGSLNTSGPYVHVGSLGELITAPPGTRTAKVGFSGFHVIKVPTDVDETSRRTEFDYSLSFTAGGFRDHSFQFLQENLRISGFRSRDGRTTVEPPSSGSDALGLQGNFTLNFRARGGIEIGEVLGDIGLSGTSSENTAKVESYRSYLGEVVGGSRRTLENVFLVPAIRGFDENLYTIWGRRTPEYAKESPNLRGTVVATDLGMDRDITESKLSGWLSKITGVKVRTSIAEGPQIEIVSLTQVGSFNMMNEGLGSNQLTWLLYSLAVAPTDSLLAIEEPEIHLHPGAQAKLADIFVEEITQEKKQLVLTTHSEHILLRLLTAVAQGRLSLDDLAVNYFQKDEQGFASVTPLEIDSKGRVKGGLPGFFEADLENLDAFVKALSKKG